MRLTVKEQELVVKIENLRQEMDTSYRKEAIMLAQFGRDIYDAVSRDRIGNLDPLNVPFPVAIINHRLATLWANPSKAEVKTVDPNKQNNVEIYKQVDAYDKDISSYKAVYQDLERTAHIEGSCFFGVDWNEMLDDMGRCIGVPHTKVTRIRLNDFWWDQSARCTKEMNHGLRRIVMGREQFITKFYPLKGSEYFKNIEKVEFMSRETCENVFDEEWEDENGNYVTIWHFESKAFYDEKAKKVTKKKVLIANGVPIYESDDLTIPPVNDIDLLPWSKIDCMPNGYMVGTSIPVLIRHIQEAFSRLLTLSVAQSELNASPSIFVRSGASSDWDDFPTAPGAIVPVRGSGKSISDDYQVFQVPDISQGAQKIMNDLVDDMVMVTGVDFKALFVPASEKAITTQNKREIQEKLLKLSVLNNEENGFKEMELMRLSLIQNKYPEKRTFLERRFGGKEEEREGYMKVKIKDHEIEHSESKGEKLIKLNFKEGAFTELEISPEHIQFNVDLTIEGATSASDRDALEKRNFIENLQLILSIPAFAEKIAENPDKALKYILKEAGIPEGEFLETKPSPQSDMHPAMKEIAAIRLAKVLTSQGFNVPDDIPEPEEYDPKQFLEVFEEHIRNGSYKTLSRESQKIFDERKDYHEKNAMNPYFMDLQAKSEEQDQQMQAQEQQMMPQGGQGRIPQPQQPSEEGDLMTRTRQEAAQIAQASKL